MESGERRDVFHCGCEIVDVTDGVVEAAYAVLEARGWSREVLESGEEGGEIRGRGRVADESKDDVAVELDFRESETEAEIGGRESRAGPVGDADVESRECVGDADGDGSNSEAVGECEAVGSRWGEGRNGELGLGGTWGIGGGDGGGEEKLEGGATKEEGGVDWISGGKIGSSCEVHAESEGKTPGGVGGVAAPEFNMMEAEHGEAIGSGIGAHKVGVSH